MSPDIQSGGMCDSIAIDPKYDISDLSHLSHRPDYSQYITDDVGISYEICSERFVLTKLSRGNKIIFYAGDTYIPLLSDGDEAGFQNLMGFLPEKYFLNYKETFYSTDRRIEICGITGQIIHTKYEVRFIEYYNQGITSILYNIARHFGSIMFLHSITDDIYLKYVAGGHPSDPPSRKKKVFCNSLDKLGYRKINIDKII